MLLLTEAEIRELVDMNEAIAAMEAAFAALSESRAVLPPPVSLEIAEVRGEVHVKGAHLRGTPTFTFKVASGFYDNPSHGLPSGSGLMLVFDAATGFPLALLHDNAWLTDLRTGAAGGVAARYLAPAAPERVAVVGAGVQARMQLRALAAVRPLRRVRIWSRTPARARECASEMAAELGVDVAAEPDLERCVRGADTVITVTPSREPLVRAEWIGAGTHVTAVGSDGPDKIELEPALLARADRVLVDRLAQCAALGELHHAIAAGLLTPEDVAGELGDLALGRAAPRAEGSPEITVADLTGVGVQDAAIAGLVLERALDRQLGTAWA